MSIYSNSPRLGGKLAVVLFVFTLLAFVAETQLTQYVQTTLGYRQPFFIFYVVHSSFAITFPLHLLYLVGTTRYTATALLRGLKIAVVSHLSSPASFSPSLPFPWKKFLRLILALTVGITWPALLWFAAVSLSSISDVTAIWNTNAFFAYVITVKIFHLKWESRRLFAVSLATLGTMGVVYGGSVSSDSNDQPGSETTISTQSSITFKPSAPLIGDILTLMASMGYGLYQVLYKKYGALPNDPEVSSEGLYQSIPGLGDDIQIVPHDTPFPDIDEAVYPPPFGFHPNMLTSTIGFCTFAVLWIAIPILHLLGIEIFRFPSNYTTVLAIAGIAITGVVFNAGFMILLGVWGPITVSVGNLLTIVLVFLSDAIFGAGGQGVTLWGVVGSAVIVAAFGVLAYDMYTEG